MIKEVLNCLLIFIVSVMMVVGCAEKPESASSESKESKTKTIALPKITIDGIPLSVEIVQEDKTREKGLMNREKMPENQGMLFVFEVRQILSFWMRNTFIPLDIAFIDEAGEVVDIQYMEPLDESKHYTSAKPALYALEVNAGWFKRNGIKVGSKVSF